MSGGMTARTREEFAAEIRAAYSGDADIDTGQAVEVFCWLWDVREADPHRFFEILAEVYGGAGYPEEAARAHLKAQELKPPAVSGEGTGRPMRTCECGAASEPDRPACWRCSISL